MACTQCGTYGVEGICSMCYGDPDHNTDGLLKDFMRYQDERASEEMWWLTELESIHGDNSENEEIPDDILKELLEDD